MRLLVLFTDTPLMTCHADFYTSHKYEICLWRPSERPQIHQENVHTFFGNMLSQDITSTLKFTNSSVSKPYYPLKVIPHFMQSTHPPKLVETQPIFYP